MIEVVDIFLYQPSQMALTEDQAVIKTLAPDAADEPLAVSVCFGGAHRGLEHIDARCDASEVRANLITPDCPQRDDCASSHCPRVREYGSDIRTNRDSLQI